MPVRLVVLHRGVLPPNADWIDRTVEARYVTEDELPAALPGADVLLAWYSTSTAVAGAWPRERAPRWVHVNGSGVDPFLFPGVVDDPGVVLTNARGVYDRAIAEYVLSFVLAMAKDLPGMIEHQQRLEWRPRDSESIVGRTALVWGTGPIGRATARLLKAVGMHVYGAGRRPIADDPDFGTVHGPGTMPSALSEADYVVLVAPLTPQTRGMLDARTLASMKPGSRLINVGRGALVDEEALIDALSNGRLLGAALDVFTTEPLPPASPLWTMPGVLVSPHTAGEVQGWRTALATLFADNLTRHLSGAPLRNVVDKKRGYVA